MPNLSNREKSPIPNVFKLELTPPKPIINPEVPFSMTVKNMSEKIQAVAVEVDSYLFELMDARAEKWPYSQIYHTLEPGGTMIFKIGVTEETPKYRQHMEQYDVERLKKPEGLLKVYHTVTESMDDTDLAWGFEEDGYKVVDLYESHINEHGHVEMELICEKETKLTNKRRKRFKKVMSKRDGKGGCSIM